MTESLKAFFCVFISALLLSCGSSHVSKTGFTYRNEDNLRGKVKSVSVTTFKAELVSGEIKEREITQSELLLYNEKGENTKSILEASGEYPYSSNTFYIHDPKGNLTEVRTATIEGDTLISLEKYAYDNTNHKVMEIIYEPGTGDTITYEYRYDAGVLVQKDERRNGFTGKTVYEYSGGKVREEKTFDENGIQISRTVFTYEEEGKVTKSSTFRGDGAEQKSSVKRIDDKGLLVEMIDFTNESGWKSVFRYTYDLNGNVLTSTLTTSSSRDEPSTTISTYEYEYDKTGNWIHVNIKSGTDYGVVKRKFEYYAKYPSHLEVPVLNQ